jgi:hypothetical protein
LAFLARLSQLDPGFGNFASAEGRQVVEKR